MSFKPTTNNTTTTTGRVSSSRKKALCFAINDYVGTGNDLRGCVNDAKSWGSLLSNQYGFQVSYLLDRQVTYRNFTKMVGNLIADSKANEDLVITFSGHGSHTPDANGDEKDGRDESLVLYDGFLIDDSVRELLKSLHKEAMLTFISDSCHSGTVTRSFLKAMETPSQFTPRPRYMPPEDNMEAFSTRGVDVKHSLFVPEENMNEVLISGCLPTEYSYDAYINGAFRGAMSYNAVEILKKNPTITYANFHKKLKSKLPSSQYPQSPQLEGSEENKNKLMFQ